MLAAILLHTVCIAFFRFCLVDSQIPISQVVFLRSFCRLCVIICLLFATHTQPFRSKYIPLHIARACFSIPAMFFFTAASARIPMTSVSIIGYLTPIFTVVLGVCFLSEKLSAPICISAAVGFTGAYIAYAHNTTILWQTGAIFALLGAFTSAIDNIMRRHIALKDTPLNIMFYHNIFSVLIALIPLLNTQFITLSSNMWILFICAGIFITCAQYMVMKAFQLCSASTLAPLSFADIVLVIFLDALLWGHILTIDTALAALLIISSNLYYLTRK